jgi:hypothetical protein
VAGSGKHFRGELKTMKGQSSIEFMSFVSFSLLILVILMSAVTMKQNQVSMRSNTMDAQMAGKNVAFQAEMALAQGEGYERRFILPNRIAGEPYNVRVINSTLVVNWENSNFVMPTLYRGRELKFNTNETNTFRVIHNESGVYINES